MEAIFRRADLTYEAIFSTLSFDLPGLGAELLKSLYENINPQFPITAADMRVLGGSSLSDVRVQVDMFNGLGLIDVTADKLSMNFRSLQNDGDLTICKNCISLSEQAVRSALPNLQVDAVALRPTLFLALDRKVESASSHIAQVVGSAAQFNLDEFGNPAQYPGVNLEVENTEEDWNAIFNAYRDRGDQSSLIVSCHALYREDGIIRGLEERASHLERLIRAFLSGIGLEIPISPQDAT